MSRISWNSNWQGADGHRLRNAARSCGLKIIVTLDGVEQSGVFYADPEQGKIGRKVTSADGRILADPSDVTRPLVEEASGAVGFVVRRLTKPRASAIRSIASGVQCGPPHIGGYIRRPMRMRDNPHPPSLNCP